MAMRLADTFLVHLRSCFVGARAVRTVEGICAARARLECPWFGVRAFNNTGNWSPALSLIYAGCVVSCSFCIPNRPADPGYIENSNTGLCPHHTGSILPFRSSNISICNRRRRNSGLDVTDRDTRVPPRLQSRSVTSWAPNPSYCYRSRHSKSAGRFVLICNV